MLAPLTLRADIIRGLFLQPSLFGGIAIVISILPANTNH